MNVSYYRYNEAKRKKVKIIQNKNEFGSRVNFILKKNLIKNNIINQIILFMKLIFILCKLDDETFLFKLSEVTLKLKVNGKQALEALAGDRVEIALPDAKKTVSKGTKIYLASSSAVKGAYNYQKPRPRQFLQRQEINVNIIDIGSFNVKQSVIIIG